MENDDDIKEIDLKKPKTKFYKKILQIRLKIIMNLIQLIYIKIKYLSIQM